MGIGVLMDYKEILDYETELNFFLEKYAVGLIGSPKHKVKVDTYPYLGSKEVIFREEEKAFLVPVLGEQNRFFRIEAMNDISSINLNILKELIYSFNKVSKYFYDKEASKRFKTKIKIDYPSKYSHVSQLEYATQMAVARWIAAKGIEYLGETKLTVEAISNRIESLFKLLDDWSKKTYEGKSVTFSFIINPKLKPLSDDTFLDFLDEEYSATLTDCITSAFEVDLNCSFRNYLSVISKKGEIRGYQLRNGLPIRFSNIVGKLVTGGKIGVFLLSNGDIVVAQDQKILFVKRCGRWLNFSQEIFKNALLESCNNDEELIDEIFSTVMDVSFSHSGGIIAYLKTDKLLEKETGAVDEFDLLNSNLNTNELVDYLLGKGVSEDVAKKEAAKRSVKRKMIKGLLDIKGNKLPEFIHIERKLRSDLAALDGALILNIRGEVVAAGTIIKGDKGSSGGGRSTAAKTLSYDGFAIKISTDGYIEVYVKSNLIYAIK